MSPLEMQDFEKQAIELMQDWPRPAFGVKSMKYLATALKQLHDDTLERAAVVAENHRNRWCSAGGFGGHSAGARIIMDEIRSLKSPDSGGAK